MRHATPVPVPRFLDRRTPPHLVTLVAMAAVSSLAMSVFLPSLPAMAREFGADYGLLQLTVSLYLIGNALIQLFVGPLSDRYGRRPVLLAGLVIFCLATLGCLAAPNVTLFLVFRMVQAAVVAALVLSRAVIRDTHDERQSAAMIGWVMMAMSIVPLAGPAVGGWLEGVFGWRASFWLLFGCGLGLTLLVWFDLGETARGIGRPLGAQFREYPELLASPRFWGYALAAAFASGCFFGFLGGAPWVGEHVFGLRPHQVGMSLGLPALGYSFGNFLSARMSARLGTARMVLAGSLVTTAGLTLGAGLTAAGLGGMWAFYGVMPVMAAGNGMVMPNAIAGSMSVRPHLAGSASGLGGALQIAGGAVMAGLAGMVLSEGSGALPLLLVMLGSSVAALASILIVLRRR